MAIPEERSLPCGSLENGATEFGGRTGSIAWESWSHGLKM